MKKILKKTLLGIFFGLSGLLLLFLLLVAIPVPSPVPPNLRASPLAITNVSVIDLEADTLLAGQTVVIENGRIMALDSHALVTLPDHARRIDGTDKFLIPGLWDMHAHHGTVFAPQLSLPLFIAAGITNVRDLGGHASLEQKNEWRERILNGTLLGPRIMGQAGLILFSMETEDEARRLIDDLDEGSGFIKVYNQVLPGAYFALLDAARQKGIDVLGHRPRSVSAVDAARAGHKSFEHARLFLFECYPGAKELRERYRARYAGEVPSTGRLDSTATRRAMIDEHDPEMFDKLVTSMIESGTWFCPTHITRKMDAFADNEAYRQDTRLKYIHFLDRIEWASDANGMIERDPTPEGRKAFMDFYEKGLELTGKAHQAGVKILAGSDAHDTYCFPGFGLHDELQELVKAGLTPMQALKTATVNPAEYFGRSDDYGSVAVGKVADLVLLDANPLDSMANIGSINSVIYDGILYSRQDLDEALDYVESNARSLGLAAKTIWANMRP
jgi:imidazolonepropionase-like amidohydrolase